MVNVPPILDTFVSLLKKCVPEKLTHRVRAMPINYIPKAREPSQVSF